MQLIEIPNDLGLQFFFEIPLDEADELQWMAWGYQQVGMICSLKP